MDKTLKMARRASGQARFERECRTMTTFGGRTMLAYRVPGTREHGQLAMLQRRTWDTARKLREETA